MKSRVLSVGVLVAGLLSSVGMSLAASGCSSTETTAAPGRSVDQAESASGEGSDAESAAGVRVSAAVDPEAASGADGGGTVAPLTVTTAAVAGVESTSSPAPTTDPTSTTGTPSTSAESTATATETSSTETSSIETGTTGTTGTADTTAVPTTAPGSTSPPATSSGGVVGQRPDGVGNPAGVCLDGVIQPMADDKTCGYADIGGYCLEQINYWRAQEGLEPFVRLEEFEACAAREARRAVDAARPHYSDNCGWRAQASSGGGRGGDGSAGTIEKSVWWLPKLIFDEGPEGGHYQGMMTERVRGVSCGYFARNRDEHRIIINYYDL
ncbi:MAG: CAP domain-containing protein [Actinomycetota bacterium]